jgi:hypothetical protein
LRLAFLSPTDALSCDFLSQHFKETNFAFWVNQSLHGKPL